MNANPVDPVSTNGGFVMEALIFLGILGFWVLLNAWILPKAGVNT